LFTSINFPCGINDVASMIDVSLCRLTVGKLNYSSVSYMHFSTHSHAPGLLSCLFSQANYSPIILFFRHSKCYDIPAGSFLTPKHRMGCQIQLILGNFVIFDQTVQCTSAV